MIGSTYGRKAWPVLLLLVAVIVPTVSMLWFMLAAIDNERVAVRQRMIDAYRAQLIGVRAQLTAGLLQTAGDLDRRFGDQSCALTFATLVRAGEADSVICSGANERYPDRSGAATVSLVRPIEGWDKASRLERRGESAAAADAFAWIASAAGDPEVAARALQAQARCLSKSSRREAAIRVLSGELSEPRYRSATDSRGRLIVPSAQLLALQLIDDPLEEPFPSVAAALHNRLLDYGEPVMPAAQRRFLMSELRGVAPGTPEFDTRVAEDLAAGILDSDVALGTTPGLTRTATPGLWQVVSDSARIVTLHTEVALRERLLAGVEETELSDGATAELLPPGVDAGTARAVVAFSEDEPLSGWRLALNLDDKALVDAATGRQVTAYVWTGALVVVLIVAATILIAGAIQRQMRATQLKNDLLATVSHELKTPLTSMRLLVETLLDGRHEEPRRVREYLGLISKENDRLLRLVDNFLSFSRMERNMHDFERVKVTAEELARAAESALGERAHTPQCPLEVAIAPELPAIDADSDAIVAAILNLLDNAYKYSGEEKRVALRVFADGGDVCFAVSDNGIGLSARDRGKIFERFYQVDQSLSRQGGGCGLGLSIVRLIVKAHGGRVDVKSRPGKGSTFTIRLPAAEGGGKAEARQEALVN